MPGRPARLRRERHFYVDPVGRRKPRAAFVDEGEAHAAANRVFAATGRRYSAFQCQFATCEAWHIRQRPLRPTDLARSA